MAAFADMSRDGIERTTRRGFHVAALATLIGILPRKTWARTAPASADSGFWSQPRVVRVRNANTGRGGEFVYWRDGQYVMPEYLALSALALDHRANEAVQIEPGVFDLIFATQAWYFGVERRRVLTELTSAYRTPATNQAVGGALGSLHVRGAAADGRMEGVTVASYAAMLMAFRAGGVGLYERHVHWDVGRPPAFWRGGRLERP